MAEDKDLVHILKLLDDESPTVRTRVWEKLEANLPAWEAGIRARLDDLPSAPRRKLLDLLSGRARKGFRSSWLRWREMPSDMDKLEAALSGLSWYLSENSAGRDMGNPAENGNEHPASDTGESEEEEMPPFDPDGIEFERAEIIGRIDPAGPIDGPPRHPDLGPLLDGLAAEFRETGAALRPSELAHFLFSEKGLKGSENDYYNPGNSDLVQVIEKGKGIPISLACIYMLVGHRLGFEISGCDVPEHFLTRASEDGKDVIIDCFDGGKALDSERLGQLERKYAPEFTRLLKSPAQPEAIVARVLRNLINAYHLAGNRQASQFMWSLAEDLRGDREGDGDKIEN
jgi:hypothetical protein